MRLLAIETSTAACSVALNVDGEVLERFVVENRSHGERVLPWVAELTAEAGLGYRDLDGIAVSRGPGGFTSLRIGLAIAQGLALGSDLPLYPVSSLAILAREGFLAAGEGQYLAVLDARMGEVYFCGFETDAAAIRPMGAEALARPETVRPPGPGGWTGCGSGFLAHARPLAEALGGDLAGVTGDCWPRARSLLALAATVDPRPASMVEPVYLRDRVAG